MPTRARPGNQRLGQGNVGEDLTHDPEVLGILEPLQEDPALLGAGLIVNHRAHVPHVGVDCKPQNGELNHGDKQGEEQSCAIAEDVEHFFPGHRTEATKVKVSRHYHVSISSFLALALGSGESYKDVLEAGFGRKYPDPFVFQVDAQIRGGYALIDECAYGLTEDRGLVHGGMSAKPVKDAGSVASDEFEPSSSRRGNGRLLLQLIGRANGQQMRVKQVSHPVTSFGLVHVVRGDKERDALGSKPEEQVPEVAASHGVNAGRRLVKKDEVGPVQQGTGQRQALLPASRESAGPAVEIRAKPYQIGQLGLSGSGFRLGKPVDSRVEIQVLASREVLVKREFLRHVTDLGTDRLGVARWHRGPGPGPSPPRAAASRIERESESSCPTR